LKGRPSATGAAQGFFYADPARSLAESIWVVAANGFLFLAFRFLLRIAARSVPWWNKGGLTP
jgi:hypothetical protein